MMLGDLQFKAWGWRNFSFFGPFLFLFIFSSQLSYSIPMCTLQCWYTVRVWVIYMTRYCRSAVIGTSVSTIILVNQPWFFNILGLLHANGKPAGLTLSLIIVQAVMLILYGLYTWHNIPSWRWRMVWACILWPFWYLWCENANNTPTWC